MNRTNRAQHKTGGASRSQCQSDLPELSESVSSRLPEVMAILTLTLAVGVTLPLALIVGSSMLCEKWHGLWPSAEVKASWNPCLNWAGSLNYTPQG